MQTSSFLSMTAPTRRASMRTGASSRAFGGSEAIRDAGTISMQLSGQMSWQPPQRMHSVPAAGCCSKIVFV